MIVALLCVIFLVLIFNVIGYRLSAPKYNGPASDHFDGKRFINPGNVKAKGLPEVLKWMVTRKKGEWKVSKRFPPTEKPVSQVEGTRITFVNHSTFLIQADGVNILTDPVWSKRASPFSWIGPKRMRPPGIRFKDLPPIHIIVLSHNHYDHLDIKTVKKLYKKHKPIIITPLGVKAFLEKNKIRSAHDLDWWQAFKVSNILTIHAVPAQHFSGRGGLDRDATLWCGYVLQRPNGNIYFIGDTGYNNTTFKEIGNRFAPINISLIPIGAYKPEWFMSAIHCSPKEALQIHLDTKSEKSIATHFGTFALADDGKDEAVDELKAAMKNTSVTAEDFLVLPEGVGFDF